MQIIALDTATPQLRTPPSGSTYSAPRAIVMTPETLTGSSATSSLSIAQTWNTTGTPTAIDLNVTDTASNAASLLMNLRVGGSTRARFVKDGSFELYASATRMILASPSVGGGAARLGIGNGGSLTFSAAGVDAGTPDLFLTRDAANTLAQRNGVNAQTLRVYNTFTDASNYERGKMEWASNVLRIGTEKAGTGTARALEFQTDGTTRLTIAATGNVTAESNFYAGTTAQIGWTGRAAITSPINTNDCIALLNNAANGFGRLQFGGTTASFPALKRNGTALETKLADDSAFAPHAMQYLDVTDGVTAPSAATGRARIYVDTADGDLKVVFADGTVKTIVTDT